MARLTWCWPRTSAKSTSYFWWLAKNWVTSSRVGASAFSPVRNSKAFAQVADPVNLKDALDHGSLASVLDGNDHGAAPGATRFKCHGQHAFHRASTWPQ